MLVDVIIATHNRAAMLRRCVQSIIGARTGPQFDFVITIVDNHSSDETPEVVARLVEQSRGRIRALGEKRLGKSFAVNAGLVASSGEVIAFTDDDQVVGEEWLLAVYRAAAEGFDFVSGPVYGQWEIPPPAWYDDRLKGVLSLCDGGLSRFEQYEHDLFSGGNAAVTRAAIERVGGLHTALGKIAGRFSMCEDGELLLRLKSAGFRGVYDPAMSVRHVVPNERLTKQYFRRWHRGYGSSMASVDALHPLPGHYWLGIPRFQFRRTIESFPRMLAARFRGDLPGVFAEELNLWFMLGYIAEKITSKSLEPAPRLRAKCQ